MIIIQMENRASTSTQARSPCVSHHIHPTSLHMYPLSDPPQLLSSLAPPSPFLWPPSHNVTVSSFSRSLPIFLGDLSSSSSPPPPPPPHTPTLTPHPRDRGSRVDSLEEESITVSVARKMTRTWGSRSHPLMTRAPCMFVSSTLDLETRCYSLDI